MVPDLLYAGLFFHLVRVPFNVQKGLCYNQLNNNLTSQAATMNTHGLPNDVLSNLDPFALIIFIPICDLMVGEATSHSRDVGLNISQIYPALSRRGWELTALKKIAWGFTTGTAAMIWAAVVQHYIYKVRRLVHPDPCAC